MIGTLGHELSHKTFFCFVDMVNVRCETLDTLLRFGNTYLGPFETSMDDHQVAFLETDGARGR